MSQSRSRTPLVIGIVLAVVAVVAILVLVVPGPPAHTTQEHQ